MDLEIDFVILWVDGNDQAWQKEYLFYKNQEKSNKHGINITRFRDWDNLQYWFRSIEKNCPWVRKIHFVTCGHYPEWLNKSHPKLNLVKHSDFIDSKFLPTFSSHTIELNIHRIEGLSEKFVYFNDDFFINKPLKPDFFFKNNLPCDHLVIDSLRQVGVDHFFGCIRHRSMALANKYFKKKHVIKQIFFKVYNPLYGIGFILNLLNYPMGNFSYLSTPHLPQAFRKSTFFEVWQCEQDFLESVCLNKFRQATDVNQYLFRNWHLLKGEFYPVYPYNRGLFKNVSTSNISLIIGNILESNSPMLCINDAEVTDDYDYLMDSLKSTFDIRYPQKSSYEK